LLLDVKPSQSALTVTKYNDKKMPRENDKRGLDGLRVLSFESRRSREMAQLIANYGGEPLVAPSMREAPIESNAEALAFAHILMSGGYDIVIFLTGVGTRALIRVMETAYEREQILSALRGVRVVARGPKPVAVLQELKVPVAVAAPEPNTWRELLKALDPLRLAGCRVAVQEYGATNAELLAGLADRGAKVTRVPVYQWVLPEDLQPLRAAIQAVARGNVDVALFTTSVHVSHVLTIAAEMKLEPDLRDGFNRLVIGSIGPITSEALRERGIQPDFEPVHPKMGFLVSEAAHCATAILRKKRDARAENTKTPEVQISTKGKP
jgi:uroporphyrinogen-III synthase